MQARKLLIGLYLWMLSFSGLAVSGPSVLFIENKNQWPHSFLYGADFPGARVFVKSNGLFFLQYEQELAANKEGGPVQSHMPEGGHRAPGSYTRSTYEISFVDAMTPVIVADSPSETIFNFYLGDDPGQWGQAAPSFREIQYQCVYNDIDMKLYSSETTMKYDWVIGACADPAQIKMKYKGVLDLRMKGEDLLVETRLGEVTETKPYAYQIINGIRQKVQCRYKVDGYTVGFEFPDGYDQDSDLIIDPVLIFSSYSGSLLDNWGNTATPDSKGNLYSGGMVSGGLNEPGFPTTPGAYQTNHHGGIWDVGILKYDSVGARLLYVTYLGGSGVETPQSLVVNKDDELLVLGATGSSNFPVTTGAHFKGGTNITPLNGVEYSNGTDIFIARFSKDGSQLKASTYLGGTSNDAINFVSGDIGSTIKVESMLARNYGDQLRGDILADEDGSILIASSTLSSDFPLVNTDPDAAFHGGSHDGVIARLSPDLTTVIWSRLIGGSATDVAYSVKLDKDGNIYAAGGTNSNNLAGMDGLHTTSQGGIDGWIIKLNATGDQILHGTYLGTNAYDQTYFIDIGTTGDVFAYGQTKGSYPFTSGVVGNPGSGQFLHRLSGDLKTTRFSLTFGSIFQSPNISPTAFLVNDCNNIYMAGWGGRINSPNYFGISTNYVGGDTRNMAVTTDAYQRVTVEGNDFYLMVLTGDAKELVYATYLGGTTSLTHVDGGTSRFDKRGIVYHAVCASCGQNVRTDFPAVNVPADRSRDNGPNCSNAAFKFDLSALRARIQTNNIQLKMPGYARVCLPDGIVFQNQSINGQIFEWDLGDGTKLTKVDTALISHYYVQPGQYTVKLKVIDHSTCIGEDSTKVVIDVFQPAMVVGPDVEICYGSSTRLQASGGQSYAWRTKDNAFTSSLPDPLVSPATSTEYFVSISDINGCTKKDTVLIEIQPGLDLAFDVGKLIDCEHRPTVWAMVTTELTEENEARFEFGDGSSLTAGTDRQTHDYEQDGMYTISLHAHKGACAYTKEVTLPVYTLHVPNAITPGVPDQLNDHFRFSYQDQAMISSGITFSVVIYSRWGREVYRNADYRGDWNGDAVESGVYYYEVEIKNEIHCKGWLEVIK